jgi:hypothetical protein
MDFFLYSIFAYLRSCKRTSIHRGIYTPYITRKKDKCSWQSGFLFASKVLASQRQKQCLSGRKESNKEAFIQNTERMRLKLVPPAPLFYNISKQRELRGKVFRGRGQLLACLTSRTTKEQTKRVRIKDIKTVHGSSRV